MTAPDSGHLPTDVRAVVEQYIVQLEAGLCRVSRPLADDLTAEALSHLLDVLGPDSTVDDANAAIAEFGPPDEYAAAMCAEISGGKERIRAAAGALPEEGPGSGTFLGMPYDVRPPTAERLRSRWWNPADPRVFMPRAWGVGWDLNFGALAVRTHLIRPDDADEPFAHVPEAWLYAALCVPVLATAWIAGTWALVAASLPAELPVHWDITGSADRFSDAPTALGWLLFAALVPTVWALITFVLGRSRGARVLVTAFATFFCALAVPLFWFTIHWTEIGRSFWLMPLSILSCGLAPFTMLVVLARIDRKEAWRRELHV